MSYDYWVPGIGDAGNKDTDLAPRDFTGGQQSKAPEDTV